MVRLPVALSLLLCLASVARAQDAEASPDGGTPEGSMPTLPPPVLEGEEPVAPAEPSPAPEPEAPQILAHIGTGDHPERAEEEGELPRDIGFDIPMGGASPGQDPRQTTAMVAPSLSGVDPEEPPLPFVITVGAGFARLLAMVPLDFFRLEERFEAAVPDFPTLRLGASLSQMFGPSGTIVGGGARVGMGVTLCDERSLSCEGVLFAQPGFLAGLTGTRFDLNASLSLRLVVARLVQVAIDAGYSLQLGDNASLLHVTFQAGFVF